MPQSISTSKLQHRFDSPSLPVITAAGYASFPKLFLARQKYLTYPDAPYTWTPRNESHKVATLELRETARPNWSYSAGIGNDGDGDLSKSGSEGFSGAIGNNPVSTDVAIEGQPVSLSHTVGISLQSRTLTYNFFSDVNAEHFLVFGASGRGSIWEFGQGKVGFDWQVGDKGMIERIGSIVRYYLIKSTGDVTLLRTTRSKLLTAVTPVGMLYHTGSQLNNVFIYYGVISTATMETVGVLYDFLDWENEGILEDTAEITVLRDKSIESTRYSPLAAQYTFPIQISPRTRAQWQGYVDFYKYHLKSKDFLFIDKARDKEFWVKFAAALTDKPLTYNLFGLATQLQQSLRQDKIYL